MIYLTLEEAQRIILEKLNNDRDEIRVIETATKIFKWGFVFYIQSKEFIETGENPLMGAWPRLVDRINGSIHPINYLGILDKQLENYRRKMGYPHVIKFPIKEDLSRVSDLERVFALMDTRELIQIEKAIKIVIEKNLFNLEGLGQLCHNYKIKNITEAIALFFSSTLTEYVLYESPLKKLPKEIVLFKKTLTSLWISWSQLEEIPNSILELKKLELIEVTETPLKKIVFDLSSLTKLKEVILERTGIKQEAISKFILPKGCKMTIS